MKATIQLESDTLAVSFPYSEPMVAAVKELDNRRRWDADRKLWKLPAEELVLQRLIDLFGLDPLSLTPELRKLANGSIAPRPPLPDLSILDDWRWLTTPYEHQRRGVAELIEHPRWLLAWEQGVGKSAIVANRLRWEMEQKPDTHCLILCPKSLLSVWPDELMKHAALPCTVLLGDTETRRETLNRTLQKSPIIVCNYESLLYIGKELEACKFDVVVADEAQRLKTGSNKTSRAARKVSAYATYRWALSGTPAPNGPLDYYGILTFLDPKILGTDSKVAFEAKYAIKRVLANGVRMVVGYQNLDDLRRRVATCSSRVLKEDCLDLPPKVYVERRTALDGEQRRVYADLRRHAIANLKTAKREGTLTLRNILSESLRLLQCAGGHVPDDLGQMHHLEPNVKMTLLFEVIEEIGDKPVVIWCAFREELRSIAEALADRGVSLTVIHGDRTPSERTESIRAFQAGEVTALLATPQTGGSGLTLTRADTEIFYSRTFDLQHWLQAQDRLHRIGQRNKVTVISLVCTGTVDEKVALALARKAELQESILTRDVEEMV